MGGGPGAGDGVFHFDDVGPGGEVELVFLSGGGDWGGRGVEGEAGEVVGGEEGKGGLVVEDEVGETEGGGECAGEAGHDDGATRTGVRGGGEVDGTGADDVESDGGVGGGVGKGGAVEGEMEGAGDGAGFEFEGGEDEDGGRGHGVGGSVGGMIWEELVLDGGGP